MQRIKRIPVQFGDKIYDFDLYIRTLLDLGIGPTKKFEYTEKICGEVACIFECDHQRYMIEDEIIEQKDQYELRVLSAIHSWETSCTDETPDENGC